MHPIDYLFKDIYRNYWGIPSVSAKRASERHERQVRPFRLGRGPARRGRNR